VVTYSPTSTLKLKGFSRVEKTEGIGGENSNEFAEDTKQIGLRIQVKFSTK
jgi:hypothetical protein